MKEKLSKIRILSTLMLLILSALVLLSVGLGFAISHQDIVANAQPQFIIGQQFFYRTSLIPIYGEGYYFEEAKFTVTGLKEINNISYFEIQRDINYYFFNPATNVTRKIGNNTNTWYCDRKDGNCIGRNADPKEYTNENNFVTDGSFFAYWMLGLNENAELTMRNVATENIGGKRREDRIRYDFKVIGKEMIDGRESFKVKATIIDENTQNIKELRYYWVDSTNRILIKKESYTDNGIKNFEETLIAVNNAQEVGQ